MPQQNISRRNVLKYFGIAAGATALWKPKLYAATQEEKFPFTFCLNTATIRGQNLGFIKELEVAATAGFSGVEIWIDTLKQYLNNGGSVKEIKNKLASLNLKIENCIAFHEWVVDDDATRNANTEEMKKDIELLASFGCKRIAATGKGLTNDTTISLDTIAERYKLVLELGVSFNVIPLLEMWGFQKQFSTVSEVTYCAMQTGNASAKILLDVFHIYKGGSSLNTLPFINPEINDILHMNDYPSTLSREVITDADRIYPGDGVAPLKQILKTLKRKDQPLILSAELFNKDYYKQDALLVAKTALNKMKAVARDV
jgi:sugar phosphate isomerase/epimerase